MALKYLSEAGIKEIFRLLKQKYLAKADASDVATSGSYTDLINKPTKVSEWLNDAGYLVPADIAGKANAADLKTVAFSGAYSDLTGKPTIPTVPVISTNVAQDADDNTKTVSPAAVAAYVEAAAGVAIDGKMDENSQNPVQNMAICAALAAQEALIVTAEADFENGWITNPSTAAKVIYDASAAGKIVVGRFSHTKNGTATTTDMLLQSCNESGINLHTCVFAASDEEYHYSVLLNTLYTQCEKKQILETAITSLEDEISDKADKSELPQTTGGAFTPGLSEDMSAMVQVMQIGDVGYVTGSVEFSGATIADLPNRKLGELANVSAPLMKTYIPCQSFDGTSWHTGYLVIETTNEVYANCVSTDTLIIFNGYYLA